MLFPLTVSAFAQECSTELRGGWEGKFQSNLLFKSQISIRHDDSGKFVGSLESSGGKEVFIVSQSGQDLKFQSDSSSLTFDGRLSTDKSTIDGFIGYASDLYRVSLPAESPVSWSTTWSPLPADSASTEIDLYFDDDGSGGTAGYLFFRDERLPGLYGYGTQCGEGGVRVSEKNLGMIFEATFNEDNDELQATVTGPAGTTEIVFEPMSSERLAMSPGATAAPPRAQHHPVFADRAPLQTDDGWSTSRPSAANLDIEILEDMIDSVTAGELPLTHSILVARSGKLVVEEYFYGYDRDLLHDMRSASKSIASTLIGLAIDRKMIHDVSDKALKFFPEYSSFSNWDPMKSEIRIQDLLTMSSGLDANDSDRSSVASEGRYQSQVIQQDWTKLALDAPMIATPGTRLIYGGANPLILGSILDNVVGERLEWFAETNLFRPLGIHSYKIYLDPTGVPYMGGGVHLRPRDMLKYGQLYLDKGRWLGQQVLSEEWIGKSFGKYGRLEPLDRNGNEYGYLWWHEVYRVNGNSIASIEARGNGGQYVFVIPQLDVTAVITSGNYRGGLTMTRQPQRIFERYILPALLATERR